MRVCEREKKTSERESKKGARRAEGERRGGRGHTGEKEGEKMPGAAGMGGEQGEREPPEEAGAGKGSGSGEGEGSTDRTARRSKRTAALKTAPIQWPATPRLSMMCIVSKIIVLRVQLGSSSSG